MQNYVSIPNGKGKVKKTIYIINKRLCINSQWER